MKPPRLLLALSLAANLTLAIMLFRPSVPPAVMTGNPTAKSGDNSPALKPQNPASASALPDSPSVAAPGDRAALRDRLRQLGFSETAVREALRAAIEAPRRARERALRPTGSGTAEWLRSRMNLDSLSTADRQELLALRRNEHDEMLALFGPVGLVTEADLNRFALFSPEKALRLAVIERDYEDLRRENGPGGYSPFKSAAVAERDRTLTADHDRAIAAILTPEEYTKLTIRDSQSANRPIDAFDYFDATEPEFRAIYAAQKIFDDQYPSSRPGDSSPARREAETQLNQAIAAALGPERYAEWTRSQRMEHRALIELQRRLNLDSVAVTAVAGIPAQLSAATQRIAADASLTPEQKSTAIKNLVAPAREQVRATLGSAYGDAYLTATGSGGWLGRLEQGTAFAYDPDGSMRSVSLVSRSAPPPPSPAPKP